MDIRIEYKLEIWHDKIFVSEMEQFECLYIPLFLFYSLACVSIRRLKTMLEIWHQQRTVELWFIRNWFLMLEKKICHMPRGHSDISTKGAGNKLWHKWRNEFYGTLPKFTEFGQKKNKRQKYYWQQQCQWDSSAIRLSSGSEYENEIT